MKKNKAFVKAMIATAILGLLTLMGVMFIGVRWFLDDRVQVEAPQEVEVLDVPEVPLYSTILGVIQSIDSDRIQLLDIEKKQVVNVTIDIATQIKDNYDNPIPKEVLEGGDIVQLLYEPLEDKLIEVSLYTEGWTKTNLKTFKIDRSNRQITIGQNVYNYNDETLILGADKVPISIHQVGDYDLLELQGIDEKVYSIKVLEKQGYLELKNIPSEDGTLEIGLSRQIALSSIVTLVPIESGQHNIVIRTSAYEPMVSEIEVREGEVYILDLDDLERKYTSLSIWIQNSGVTYEVYIDDLPYPTTEPIRLPMDTYKVEIRADGYYTWERQVNLTEDVMTLQVQLQPVEQEEEEDTEENDNNDNDTDEDDEIDNTVNIETDPQDAQIYINGEYKGLTPYKTQLELGSYTITLRKEGYETYETSIIVDSIGSQNNYLYMLIPEEDESEGD